MFVPTKVRSYEQATVFFVVPMFRFFVWTICKSDMGTSSAKVIPPLERVGVRTIMVISFWRNSSERMLCITLAKGSLHRRDPSKIVHTSSNNFDNNT